MRVSILCELCGHRHRVAREIYEAGPVRIVCHNCEEILSAQVTEENLAKKTQTPSFWTSMGLQ